MVMAGNCFTLYRMVHSFGVLNITDWQSNRLETFNLPVDNV